MRRIGRRVAVTTAIAAAIVVLTPIVASAHPLGNFTINQFAGLHVRASEVQVDYVVDMAEIPTFQARSTIDRNHDGTIEAPEGDAYALTRCGQLVRGLHLVVDGNPASLASGTSVATLPIGQAGLPTLRLECGYRAGVDTAAEHRLRFTDANLEDRIGWREVTAIGDGATIRHSSVPRHSISDRLTNYPSDRLQSPLDVRDAVVDYRMGGGAAAPIHTPVGSVVRGFDGLTNSFVSSVARRDFTVGVALVSLAIGLALGAVHAFAPGHGKAVMAAYLVGQRGRARDGLMIGTTIAATHTLGVLVLGGVLTASQQLAPERLFPYLGLASGLCFVGLGATLLWRALQRRRLGIGYEGHHHGWRSDPRRDASHAHDHDHDQDHGGAHSHPHRDAHAHHHGPVHAADPAPGVTRRGLLTLGFAGGLVPTPTAVVVLLGATAIGRAWFGVALVLAYGVGMATTLVAAGVLLSWARRRFDLHTGNGRLLRYATVIPVVTAAVVTASGLFLVGRSVVSV